MAYIPLSKVAEKGNPLLRAGNVSDGLHCVIDVLQHMEDRAADDKRRQGEFHILVTAKDALQKIQDAISKVPSEPKDGK